MPIDGAGGGVVHK